MSIKTPMGMRTPVVVSYDLPDPELTIGVIDNIVNIDIGVRKVIKVLSAAAWEKLGRCPTLVAAERLKQALKEPGGVVVIVSGGGGPGRR